MHILDQMKFRNIILWKFRNKGLLENKIIHSMFHAIAGLIHAFHRQRNLKIMTGATILTVLMGFAFSLTLLEWFLVIYAVFCVFITELINTSIELVVDLVTKEYRLKAMLAKDVAAAATLIAVFQSIIIATVIVLNRLNII